MYGKKITATVLTILLVFAMLPVQVLAGEELTEDLISDEIDVIDGDPEIEDIQEENLNADGMLPEEDGLTPDGYGGEYTLTLKMDYSDAPDSVIQCSEYTLPLYPEDVRDNYIHVGWCTKSALDPDGSDNDIKYNPGTVIKLTEPRTLYAKWKKKSSGKHIVRFCANGGSGDYMDAVSVDDNSEYTVPACKFYSSGVLFNGWATTADGQPQYHLEDTITVNGNTTLYATWWKEHSALDDISRVDNGDHFYFGRISWRIIGTDDQGKKKLLISDALLGDYMTWNDAKADCDTVYNNSFSFTEKTAVMRVNQNDKDYDAYKAANLSNAKLFLLSAYEAVKYFVDNEDRKPSNWWLRSPHNNKVNYAGVVDRSGIMDYRDVNSDIGYGARPAFVLNLESVLFTSAAEGGKSSAPSDGSSFGAFLSGIGSKKLTLHDSTRDVFSASVNGQNNVTIGSGERSLTVNYKGAVTGTGEMVSAMLCTSDGSVIGYASVTPTTQEAASWDMTLPALSDGVYTLKVFSEQQNGTLTTDYASRISEITLTVGESAKSDQTITASGFTKTYGDKAFAIEATADGGGTLSYSSDNASVADVDNNGTVTIKGAGEANITITASETESYNSATKKIKITVNKADQSITASDVTKTMGDASFSLGAKASGGGKLTYTSGNTSVVTVDTSGTVTVKGAGKATIKIDAVETDNYNSATKTVNVTVNAAPDKVYKVTALTDGNGTASADPTSGTTDTTVTITANPNNGYDFKEWNVVSGDVKLADPKKASTTFKIGSANVEVKAIFEQKTTPSPEPSPEPTPEVKTSIKDATVKLSKTSLKYTGKAQKPTVKSVTLNGKTLDAQNDYTVSWSNSKSKKLGTYSVTITGKGKYKDSKTVNYKIVQGKNPLTVKLKKNKLNVPLSKLTKGNQTIKRSKYLKVSKNQGKVTYKRAKGNKKIGIDKKTGNITVKKSLKAGSYDVTISVKAAGNKNYKAETKKVTVRIVVK